jgi:hypothetical protein
MNPFVFKWVFEGKTDWYKRTDKSNNAMRGEGRTLMRLPFVIITHWKYLQKHR